MNCMNCFKWMEAGGEDHYEIILLEDHNGNRKKDHLDVCRECAYGLGDDEVATWAPGPVLNIGGVKP